MEHNYVAIEKNNKADKCIDVKNAVDHKYVSIGPCKSKIFQCHVCDSVFKHRASLYKHLKGIHKVIPGGKKCMKCLENDCDAEFSTTNSFRNHLASVHNIEILTVELLFKTMSDFEIWKSDLESDNNVQYVKDTGAHLSKNKMNFFYYYRCNRTGKYRNHTNQQGRRRKLKSQGTDKINNHCTSSITVQEPLNKELDIKVSYCVTHYGHNIDLKHIRLSNAERNYIVERLRQGDSVDSILHEIKNSAVSTKFEKIHFVTRKNILRIGKSYGIDMVKEEEDKKERYSRKAKNTQERHNQAMAMPLSAVRKTSAESWIVSSNNQEEYTVIKNEFLEENHLCFSKCKDCEICIHLFSCECADNIVKSELCEHIHLVVRFLNEKDSMQNTREESLGISSDDEEDLNKLLLQQEKPVSLTQKKEQVLSEIQKLTSAVMEIDNEETLDSVLQEVIVMENILMKKQEGRSDKENLQELVNSVNNNRTGIQYTHKKIALGKSQATVLFKTLTKEFSMSDLLISVKK